MEEIEIMRAILSACILLAFVIIIRSIWRNWSRSRWGSLNSHERAILLDLGRRGKASLSDLPTMGGGSREIGRALMVLQEKGLVSSSIQTSEMVSSGFFAVKSVMTYRLTEKGKEAIRHRFL